MFNLFNLFQSKKKLDSQDMNTLTAWDYYDRLELIALSLFEWSGLPDSCSPRFLELALYENGRAIFVYDESLGFLTLRCNPSGEINLYNEATYYNAYGINYNKMFSRNECVYIRNNYLEKPNYNSVVLFASRLTEAERTIDVNVKAQKTPFVFRGTDKEKLSILNIWNKYDGNEPFMITNKNIDMDSMFNIYNTNVPYVTDKLMIYKRDIWNEAMTFFGINNTNTDKRERLIQDEVNANNEQVSVMAESMLRTRKEACELINKMYHLNVSVKFHEFTKDENQNPFNDKGGEE